MTDATTNELVVSDHSSNVEDAIAQLQQGRQALFSTVKQDTEAGRRNVLSAVMDAAPLRDSLGSTIKLANVIVQPVEMTNEQTGEVTTQPRVILINDKGEAFVGISAPVFRDVRNVLDILGMPDTWEKPLAVKVVREGAGLRQYFTLKLV